jgi:hypothetical protein
MGDTFGDGYSDAFPPPHVPRIELIDISGSIFFNICLLVKINMRWGNLLCQHMQ